MRKFLLLFAVAATALVAWLVLSDTGSSGRGSRTRGAESPEELKLPAKEEGGARGPKKTEPPRPGRAFPLSGYVRDPGGAPVAGAVVRITVPTGAAQVSTDASGHYSQDVPSPQCTFDVWASGFLPLVGTVGGYSNRQQDMVFDGDGPWTRDFVLRPAASLSGFVYDDAGQPVKGARVYVIPADFALLDRASVANVVTSDDRGAFSFPGLPAGITDLGARATGFLPRIARDVAIPERGTVQQELRLAKGREVLVTVVNAPKEAFLAFGVGVTAADSRLRGMLLPPGGVAALVDGLVGRALADFAVAGGEQLEDGRYRVLGVVPGAADVAAHVVRSGPLQMPRLPLIAEPGLSEKLDTTSPEVTLTLVPGILVTINVRDAVTGSALEPEVARRTVGVAADLPVDGEKTLYWVPRDDRHHALVFTLDGYQEAKLDLPDLRSYADAPQHPSFDVAMQPTAAGETGGFYVVFDPPLSGRVALVGRDASGTPSWQKHVEASDKEGRWSVDDVPVGVYTVSVLATGMVPTVLPQVAIARGVKDTYRVTLTAGGGLSLKVTDTAGQLLDEVHLMLKDASGNQIDVHVLSHVSEGRAFLSINYLPSAAAAKADSGLASGIYEIAVYREGYAVGRKTFEVRGTDIAQVEIALAKASK